jgi:hypothetical protein
MSFDEAAAQRVRRVLHGHANVAERKMMGALCFMLGGNICCGVSGFIAPRSVHRIPL